MDVLNLLFLSMLSDFDIILKIFFFIFIVGFVRQKITHNVLALIIISIAVIFLVFVYWAEFRWVYILYVLITMGISSIVVDFFFVSMGGEGPKKMLEEGGSLESSGQKAMKARDAVHTGIEMQQRNQAMNKLRKPFKPMPPR
jgi:hypothetical protein